MAPTVSLPGLDSNQEPIGFKPDEPSNITHARFGRRTADGTTSSTGTLAVVTSLHTKRAAH